MATPLRTPGPRWEDRTETRHHLPDWTLAFAGVGPRVRPVAEP